MTNEMQTPLALASPVVRPRVLELERYSDGHLVEIGLGYGLRWTRSWIEVRTRFELPNRWFGDDVETSARVRLDTEILEWSQRGLLKDERASSRQDSLESVVVELPSGEPVRVSVLSHKGINTAALGAGVGRRIVLCWTENLPPDAPLRIKEELALEDYRQGTRADMERRLAYDR